MKVFAGRLDYDARVALSFRTARPRDLDAVLEIYTAAYPDDRSGDARRRDLTTHPLGGLGRLALAEEDGTLAAFGFGFDVRTGFGGRLVSTMAVASVAVAPHARGRGIGTALVRHLGDRAREEGAAIGLLYPFRQGFYARLGYAPTPVRKRLELAPESVPRSFRGEVGLSIGPVASEDVEAMRAIYMRRLRRESGLLERSDAFWRRRLLRERTHHLVARRRGRVVAYVAFELVQSEPHAETTLVVSELTASDAASRRALLGALSAMRDQVASIVLEIALDDPLENVLLDADGRRHGTAEVEHAVGTLVGGPMVAVLDVDRAIEARGYARDGRFAVAVEDDAGPERVVEVTRGRARVRHGRSWTSLRTTRRGLAQMLFGALDPRAAVELGLADATEEVAAKMADVVRLPAVLPLDPF